MSTSRHCVTARPAPQTRRRQQGNQDDSAPRRPLGRDHSSFAGRWIDADRRLLSLELIDEVTGARAAGTLAIEQHSAAELMDIEWGKDGRDGQLHILRASEDGDIASRQATARIQRCRFENAAPLIVVEGRAIGQEDRRWHRHGCFPRLLTCICLNPGEVGFAGGHDDLRLGADHEAAAAIVTNRGGRTLATLRSSRVSWASQQSSAQAGDQRAAGPHSP